MIITIVTTIIGTHFAHFHRPETEEEDEVWHPDMEDSSVAVRDSVSGKLLVMWQLGFLLAYGVCQLGLWSLWCFWCLELLDDLGSGSSCPE